MRGKSVGEVMSVLSEIRPTKSEQVMKLVSAAGVDVSDWANFAKGPNHAAANPKYCYRWSFVQPGKVVVLNLWYGEMIEANDVITYKLKPGKPSSSTIGVRRMRSLEMDRDIQVALKESLPIRVVVGDGTIKSPGAPKTQAKMNKRVLDPLPWTVTAYDQSTGEYTLTRGAASKYIDQFDMAGEMGHVPGKKSVIAEVYARDPEVRRLALLRAKGLCEWCERPGFRTKHNEIFLETHHVVPLSEGGPDNLKNVVALCANHHREAHHGALRDEMRRSLLERLSVG